MKWIFLKFREIFWKFYFITNFFKHEIVLCISRFLLYISGFYSAFFILGRFEFFSLIFIWDLCLQSLLLPAIIRYCIILYKVEGEFYVFQFDAHFFWYIYMNICIYNRYEMKHLFEIFVLWIVRILLLAL